MLHFLAIWLLVRVAGRLPAPLLQRMAGIFGALAWYASPQLQGITRDHMRHVLGASVSTRERDRAARECVRTAARNYAAFAGGPYRSPAEQFAPIEAIDGADQFFGAVDRGCGVIAVSAHLGNPEFLVRTLGRCGLNLMVFTERLSSPQLHEFVLAARTGPGVRLVEAGLTGAREALQHLRAGGVLLALADRDVLGNGEPVPFFGERAPLPSGPVELALRTGAPLVPVTVLRVHDERLHITIDEPIALVRSGNHEADVTSGMLAMAAALEAGIRRAPGQWFPLTPVWSGISH